VKQVFQNIRHNHGGAALPALNISESNSGIQLELCIPSFKEEETTSKRIISSSKY
jgi:hypothetical protein